MVRSIKNLIAAVIIALSIFLFWTDVLPRYGYTSRLKPTIEERTAFLESQNQIAQKISGLYEENQRKYTELQRLSLVVPPEEGLPELLTTIEAISSVTGNIIEGLVIGKGKGEDIFNIMSLEITTNGQYLSLISLLDYLEKNIRLINIDAVSISESTVATAPTSTGEIILDFSIKATTYFLKSAEEIRQLEAKKRREAATQRQEEKPL